MTVRPSRSCFPRSPKSYYTEIGSVKDELTSIAVPEYPFLSFEQFQNYLSFGKYSSNRFLIPSLLSANSSTLVSFKHSTYGRARSRNASNAPLFMVALMPFTFQHHMLTSDCCLTSESEAFSFTGAATSTFYGDATLTTGAGTFLAKKSRVF